MSLRRGLLYTVGLLWEGVAFLCLVFPIWVFLMGSYPAKSLGLFLATYDHSTLYIFQAVVENYLAPTLWERLFAPILNMPLWAASSLFAIIFSLLGTPFLWFSRGQQQRMPQEPHHES